MTQAMRFEMDGRIYEKNEKGNRFFVTDEAKKIVKKRISETAYERAWDEYINSVNEDDENWESDAEAEIETRKAIEAEKDAEAEKNFNKKAETKAKKANAPKKARKSKDIAHESNGVTLTTKQVDFLKEMTKTSFWENGLNSALWCDVLADEIGGQFANKPMTTGAMISTICEKGIANRGTDRINGKKATFMVLTELGKQIAQELGLN